MIIAPLGQLDESAYNTIGGKARGLDFLKKHGFPIADGFLISEITSIKEIDINEINKLFDLLKTEKVAVRSSASDEDGTEFSGAGQYETCLNVTKEKLFSAIETCLSSLENERAKKYSENFSVVSTRKMNIVIEKMIDSKCAGVMFTVSPSDESKTLIECVEGLGENLVSGIKSSESYSISKSFFDYKEEKNSILSEEKVKELYELGKKICIEFGCEADLEWAIDKNDNLHFLQLRPITTCKDNVTIDEFDSKNSIDTHMLTMRNIGEMLPGAVTPLSISTSVLAIDYGMREMLHTIGSIKNVNDRPDYFCALPIQGHLFIDMTALHSMSKRVLGANAKSTNFSIMGEYKEDCPPAEGKDAFCLIKFINMIKFGKYLFSSKKAKNKLDNIVKELNIDCTGKTSKEIYTEIDKNINALNNALSCHYVCSSFSGAMNSALYITFEKEFKDKSEFQSFVSQILSSIDGIESADILCSLKKIATAIYKVYPNAYDFDSEKIENIISSDEIPEVNTLYKEFIQKHGHRSIKEAEMRSKAWKNDLPALSEYLCAVIKEPQVKETKNSIDLKTLSKRFKGTKRSTFMWIAKNARQAVIDREYSKSRIIKVIDKFKDSYISLANKMVEEKYLLDTDMIYFLTHKEIGLLINGDMSLKKKALKRRKLFAEQERIKFEDICIGKPVKIPEKEIVYSEKLSGVPVCKGKVYGKAHIVKNAIDASKLEKGEIMIAPFTDIGWSPYYSILGALVTEVGSALSHGAVVAREYSLPTVVNVKNATDIIKNGDYLFIDGENGEILKITKSEYDNIINNIMTA